MVIFEQLFRRAQADGTGEPVLYKGRRLVTMDAIPINSPQRMIARIESTHSKLRQAISFTVNGTIEVAGQVFEKGMGLWEDTAPPEVPIIVKAKDNICWVHNAWEEHIHRRKPTVLSRTMGAAMYIEQVGRLRRYFCNDGVPDEDFDDIIFSIELID